MGSRDLVIFSLIVRNLYFKVIQEDVLEQEFNPKYLKNALLLWKNRKNHQAF